MENKTLTMRFFNRFEFQKFNGVVMKILGLIILAFLTASCSNQGLQEQEGYVEVQGGKIWYKVIGSGSEAPILTLHGGPGGKCRYFYQCSPLSEYRPIILFDQLGSGRSTFHEDTTLLKVDLFIEQVKALKEHLGLKEYYMLGQSWGSALALEYYLKYPEGIKGMMFSGPFFSTELWSADADTLIMSLPDTVQNIIARSEAEGNFETPEYKYADMIYWGTFGRRNIWKSNPLDTVEVNSNTFIYNYMWGPSEFTALGTLNNYDRVNELSQIKVPTIFIAGEYDEARKPTVEFLSRQVPNSKTIFIPDAGHSSMTDNPEAYNEAVGEFVSVLEGN